MTLDTTTYTKRIVSTSTGYVCYLGSIEVGTASTYGQAERACAEAYEDFQHIDPATLAMLAKLTPTELERTGEQALAGMDSATPDSLYDAMDSDEQAFANIVTGFLEQTPDSHRAMARAGLVLLAAAANRVGDGQPDDATETQLEERQAWHIHNAAFKQGFEEGHTAGARDALRRITEMLMEYRGGRATAKVPAVKPTV